MGGASFVTAEPRAPLVSTNEVGCGSTGAVAVGPQSLRFPFLLSLSGPGPVWEGLGLAAWTLSGGGESTEWDSRELWARVRLPRLRGDEGEVPARRSEGGEGGGVKGVVLTVRWQRVFETCAYDRRQWPPVPQAFTGKQVTHE